MSPGGAAFGSGAGDRFWGVENFSHVWNSVPKKIATAPGQTRRKTSCVAGSQAHQDQFGQGSALGGVSFFKAICRCGKKQPSSQLFLDPRKPALELQAKSPLAPRGRSLTPGLMSSATGLTRCSNQTKPGVSGVYESPARTCKKEVRWRMGARESVHKGRTRNFSSGNVASGAKKIPGALAPGRFHQ